MKDAIKDAIKITHEGVILDLEISAGAKETAIQGYNPWRKRIEVRIAQRAQKGKANAELISFFSNLFNVRSNNIQIVSGAASSKKSVIIFQAKQEDILNKLSQK